MGMAGPDILLFAVGLLIFGGAVTALVMEGGLTSVSPTGIFDVTYSTASVELARKAVADLSVQQKLDLQVTQRDVSSVTVAIQCTDPASAVAPASFNIQLQVTPPAGIEAPRPVAGACGTNVKIDIPIAPVPPSTAIQASTEREGVEALAKNPDATKAQGQWSITVVGARGGGALPVGAPAGNPGGTILVTADTWTPTLTAVVK